MYCIDHLLLADIDDDSSGMPCFSSLCLISRCSYAHLRQSLSVPTQFKGVRVALLSYYIHVPDDSLDWILTPVNVRSFLVSKHPILEEYHRRMIGQTGKLGHGIVSGSEKAERYPPSHEQHQFFQGFFS